MTSYLTSMRRDDVVSTSIQRHFGTSGPLGNLVSFFLFVCTLLWVGVQGSFCTFVPNARLSAVTSVNKGGIKMEEIQFW